MTDHERLRRALEDLATSAPEQTGRIESVARRLAVRRRRRAGGASALLVTALATLAFAGGAMPTPRGLDFLQVVGDRADERTRPSASARPSDRPSARPSARPSTSPSSRPSASARPSTRPSPPPPGSPLRLRLAVRPAEPTAGQRIVVVVGVSDGDGTVLGAEVDFGDGDRLTRRVEPDCRPASERPHRTQRTIEFPHVYDRAGRYAVAVTVRTGGCGAEPEQQSARTQVGVRPRPEGSNGPAAPVARLEQVRPSEESATAPDFVAVRVSGGDSDGYVTRMVLDWGDGTEPTTLRFPLDDCRRGDDGYPSSRRGETLRHVYAEDGVYTATLLVVSTGCDGTSEQSVRTTGRVRDPMPTPSPRPSGSQFAEPTRSVSPSPRPTRSPTPG